MAGPLFYLSRLIFANLNWMNDLCRLERESSALRDLNKYDLLLRPSGGGTDEGYYTPVTIKQTDSRKMDYVYVNHKWSFTNDEANRKVNTT